ncbi:MAG: TIR domain-containing protein [Deltaproteobacteria bacterium]|nr:TIR domain-containing protein [Deltaproteobacteria bacterium]
MKNITDRIIKLIGIKALIKDKKESSAVIYPTLLEQNIADSINKTFLASQTITSSDRNTLKVEQNFLRQIHRWPIEPTLDVLREAVLLLLMLGEKSFVEKHKNRFVSFADQCFDEKQKSYSFRPNGKASIYGTNYAIDLAKLVDFKETNEKLSGEEFLFDKKEHIVRFLKKCVTKEGDFSYVRNEPDDLDTSGISAMFILSRILYSLDMEDVFFELVDKNNNLEKYIDNCRSKNGGFVSCPDQGESTLASTYFHLSLVDYINKFKYKNTNKNFELYDKYFLDDLEMSKFYRYANSLYHQESGGYLYSVGSVPSLYGTYFALKILSLLKYDFITFLGKKVLNDIDEFVKGCSCQNGGFALSTSDFLALSVPSINAVKWGILINRFLAIEYNDVGNISDWETLLLEIQRDKKESTKKLLTSKLKEANQLEKIKTIDANQLTYEMKEQIIAAFNAMKDNLTFYKDEVVGKDIKIPDELGIELHHLSDILDISGELRNKECGLTDSQTEKIKWLNIKIIKNLFPQILLKSPNYFIDERRVYIAKFIDSLYDPETGGFSGNYIPSEMRGSINKCPLVEVVPSVYVRALPDKVYENVEHSWNKKTTVSASGIQSRKIFLSYAREDKKKVEQIYKALYKRGHKPWMDNVDILPGQNWRSTVKKTIKESDYFVAFLSKTSINKRGYVQTELKLGLEQLETIPEKNFFFIPIRIGKCEIPQSIEHLHILDIEEASSVKKLISVIEINEQIKQSDSDHP